MLSINTAPINVTGASLGAVQTAPIMVLNNGGSVLSYATSVTYQSGANWLTVTPPAGDVANSANLTANADPSTLQPGTYMATININAGEAGSSSIPVTFTVGSPGVTVQAIDNAASYQTGAVAPGSYAALFGLNLAGTNPGVTFNGVAANIIYDSSTQINLIVPSSLTGQSAAVVASVNGTISNSFKVLIPANSPGIFTPGIVNLNGAVNSQSNPATRGTPVSVYLTGLGLPVAAGSVTVNIGGQTGIVPSFAGAQPTLPALDQVNVTVPASLPLAGAVPLLVCVSSGNGQQACSNTVNLYVQ